MKYIVTRFILLALSFSLTSQFIVSAQTYVTDTIDQTASVSSCVALTYPMQVGSKDSKTDGQVSDLQFYLQDKGYLTAEPSGYFGAATKKAVQSFQRANGITPNGLVGPYTRAKIKEVSCRTAGNTTTPTSPVACTMEYRSCADGSAMPRDSNCGWREDKCSISTSFAVPRLDSVSYDSIGAQDYLILRGENLSALTNGYYVAYKHNCVEQNTSNCAGSLTTIKVSSNNLAYAYLDSHLKKYSENIEVQVYQKGGNGIGVPLTIALSTGTIGNSSAIAVTPPGMNQPLTLKLQYDTAGKESMLVGTMGITLKAGANGLSFNVYNGVPVALALRKVGAASNDIFTTNGTRLEGGEMGGPLSNETGVKTLQPGQSLSYTVRITVPAKEVPAGSYVVSLYAFYDDTNNIILLEKGSVSSNSVTIVGETSPYISGVTCDSTNSVCTIKGLKFNTTSNTVRVNGITKILASSMFTPSIIDLISSRSQVGATSNYGTVITFKPSDFGIYQAGTYFASVSVSDQLSNSVAFTSYGNATVNPPVTTTPVSTKGPGVNAMSCANPAFSGRIGGMLACYGVWDYGDEFGGDQNMCPEYAYSSGSTGCKVKTKACQSGMATAMSFSSLISLDINSTELAELAKNLNASKEAVKAQIPGLWVYVCDKETTTTNPLPSTASFAPPTLVSSSPVSQYVVGNTTFGIATFRLATTGAQATIRELRFRTTGQDAIESITIGGVTAPAISGQLTTVSGLNIPVSSTGIDVPVTVKFGGFQNSTTGGVLQNSVTGVSVTLSYIEGTSGNGTVITNTTGATSNAMTLVASKPIVTMGGDETEVLVLGAENKVGKITVSADANGKISVAGLGFFVSTVGLTDTRFSGARIADGNITINATAPVISMTSSTYAVQFNLAQPYEIPAGTSKTFSVYATINGTPSSSSIMPYVTSGLYSPASFMWKDFIGGNTALTGSSIYNFPTNSNILRSVAPGVSLTASTDRPAYNTPVEISWSVSGNPTQCVAGGAWSGNKSVLGGKEKSTFIVSPTTYTLYCISPSGTSKVTSVTVTPASVSGTVPASVPATTPVVTLIPGTVLSLPTITLGSTPTLKLEYDYLGKEASLVANYVVKITAGQQALSFSPSMVSGGGGSPVSIWVSNITTGKSGNHTISTFGPSELAPGASGTYIIRISLNPKQLLAGTYSAKLSPVLYTSAIQPVTSYAITGNTTTNSVTIIGEASPYISNVTSDASGNVTITGQRTNIVNNVLTVDGVAVKTLGTLATTNPVLAITSASIPITFKASTYKLTNGNHTVVIKNSQTGDSNTLTFNLQVVPTAAPVPIPVDTSDPYNYSDQRY